MQLDYTLENHIGIITLNNPPYNVLTSPVFAKHTELSDFLLTPALKGVIITGQGKHFCAGADLTTLRHQIAGQESLTDLLDKGKELLKIIADATVPVVAAIRGSCLGAGCEIALACHFRFAADTALIGFPEAELGLMPGLGGTCFLQDLLSKSASIELLLSGTMIQGEEAKILGLVDKTAPSKSILHNARDFLSNLTEKRSTVQIRAIMQSFRNGKNHPFEQALHEESLLFNMLAKYNLRT